MHTNRNTKIFIVNADHNGLLAHLQYLHSLGYTNVSAFENGLDCISNIHLQPEIILVDNNTQDLNGLDVLNIIKCTNPDIYVIFLLDNEDAPKALNSIKLGAFDFIVKSKDDKYKIRTLINKIIEAKKFLTMHNGILHITT